ncbi:ubiquitin-40S ribosomal protein S27a, partial [Tanacetum coccineum]
MNDTSSEHPDITSGGESSSSRGNHSGEEYQQVGDNGKVMRLRKRCPNAECGAGTFMACHKDRHYC